jgi:SAM-dependent methyltransferase
MLKFAEMRFRELYWKMRRIVPIPPRGSVNFGDLRSMKPVSRHWGLDRGLPVDRFYVEKFLVRYAQDIQGNVLEVGDNRYTRGLGKNRVTSSDVLHYGEGNRLATIIADLTKADHIDSNRFDCVICIQTLQYIYHLESAVRTMHRILKPGGVLLATFPGITSMGDKRWIDSWCWSMTSLSARKLFQDVFPEANLVVEHFGNLLAATSFLQGLAAEELQPEELEHCDPAYPLIIAVRSIKENTSHL